MSKSLQAQLKITLLDAVTAPAKTIQRSLEGLKQAAARNAADISSMKGQLVGAIAAGYGLANALKAPISAAREFETVMLDIAQKAELSDESMKALGERIRKMAPTMNQTAQEVATGMDVLMGMGMDANTAEGVIPTLGKVATAYNAQIADLARTAMAGIDNLKLKVEEMPAAMDALAQAGKAGAFELKDMAQHLPALAAIAQTNGMKGLSAVQELGTALQIVRKGAGDSSQAATNLLNVLQKITSEETVKKFKKVANIDLKKELEKTAKLGMSPIEGLATIVDQIIKKSKGKIKVGDLFTDMQVQLGVAALVNNLEEYKKIQAEVRKATGVWMEDYERRMKTNQALTKQFEVAFHNLKVSIGNALLPSVNGKLMMLTGIVEKIRAWSDANPKLAGGIVKVASALIGLRVAMIGLKLAWLFLKGGAIYSGIAALAALAAKANVAARAMRTIRAAMLALTIMSGGKSLLALAGIIGGIGVAVAAVALAIYREWEPIKNFVIGFAEAITEALGPVAEGIANIAKSVSNALGLDEFFASVGRGFQKVKEWVSDLLSNLFTQKDYSDEAEASFRETGRRAGQALVDAIKSAINMIASAISTAADAIYNALISPFIKAAQKIKEIGASVGNPFKGIGSVPVTPIPGGARAHGGPTRAGNSYLVGEKGPEIFTAGANGFVSPNSMLRQASKGGGRGGVNIGDVNVTVTVAGNATNEQVGAVVGRRVRAELEAAFADGVT